MTTVADAVETPVMPSAEQALAGRVPILFQNRIYGKYREILFTWSTFGAASYAYLVGSSLAAIGTTWIGILGYMLGLIMGTAFVAFASGVASYRFGIDTVDVSKAALGVRGAILVLIGVVCLTLGWANVLLAMTAQGIVNLLPTGFVATHSEWATIVAGLGLAALIWLLLRRGAAMMEKAAFYGAIAQIVVALIVLGLIVKQFGFIGPLFTNVPAAKAYTPDRLLQMSYAVEFGIANALGLVPYMGGLARLLKHKRHMVGPAVVGYAVCGCTLVAMVGALAVVVTGKDGLSLWLTSLAGPNAGSVLLAIILIANVGTMVAQLYVGGLAIQQISLFARMRWEWVAAFALIPSVVVAFNTQWLLDHMMVFLAYGAVMFAGTAAIMFVDYFILRRQRLIPAHLFAVSAKSAYWFWGGINWIAILVIGFTSWLYLFFFDPVVLRVSGTFRLVGASIPTVVIGALVYYVLMRLFVVGRGMGGYARTTTPQAVEVGL